MVTSANIVLMSESRTALSRTSIVRYIESKPCCPKATATVGDYTPADAYLYTVLRWIPG